jgi:AraC-like DNA-binding protein
MNDHTSIAVLMATPVRTAVDGPEPHWAESLGLGLSSDAAFAAGAGDPHGASAAGECDDRVIHSLTCALEAAEQGQDRYCTETLRLAIAVRLASLQSDIPAAGAKIEFATGGRKIRALQKWRLKRVIDYVDDHLADKICLPDLATVAGLSRMHFASQFRAATGLRPHEFLLRRRIRRAEELLQNSTIAIVEIALNVGFQTQAHFTTVFKRFVGHTPRQWRAANQLPSITSIRHHAAAGIATPI